MQNKALLSLTAIQQRHKIGRLRLRAMAFRKMPGNPVQRLAYHLCACAFDLRADRTLLAACRRVAAIEIEADGTNGQTVDFNAICQHLSLGTSAGVTTAIMDHGDFRITIMAITPVPLIVSVAHIQKEERDDAPPSNSDRPMDTRKVH